MQETESLEQNKTEEQKIQKKPVLYTGFFGSKVFYKKIYFRINKTARTYIRGLIFFAFPVHA